MANGCRCGWCQRGEDCSWSRYGTPEAPETEKAHAAANEAASEYLRLRAEKALLPSIQELLGPPRSDDFKPRPELHPALMNRFTFPPIEVTEADRETARAAGIPVSHEEEILARVAPEQRELVRKTLREQAERLNAERLNQVSLPMRIDRWTVSIEQMTGLRVCARVVIWRRVPNGVENPGHLQETMPARAKALGLGEPERATFYGDTRLEVLGAVFQFLAGEAAK